MSDNFALELFSGIGGMSLGLHSAGFESHGFDASDRAVAMANENGSGVYSCGCFRSRYNRDDAPCTPKPRLDPLESPVPWIQSSERK